LASSQACGVPRIAPSDAFQYERCIDGASRDRPHMIEARRQGENAMNANASKRGLETYDAAQTGGYANGTSRIAADCRCTQTSSYGNGRSPARTARNAVRLPGISYWP